MKLHPSILIVVLTVWSASQIEASWWDPFTTGKSTCSKTGFFVNEHDCSKFYRCVKFEFEELLPQPKGWSAPLPPSKGWSSPKVGWSPSKRSITSDESIRSKRSPPKTGWAAPTKGWSTLKRLLLVRYDFDCPCGTVFDESVSVCVYPGPSGCAGSWSSGDGWAPPANAQFPPKGRCIPPSHDGWSPPKGGWGPPPQIIAHTKGGWAGPVISPKTGWAPPPPSFPPVTTVFKTGWAPPPPTVTKIFKTGWVAPTKRPPSPKVGWSSSKKSGRREVPELTPISGWDPSKVGPSIEVLRRDGRPLKQSGGRQNVGGVYLVKEGSARSSRSFNPENSYEIIYDNVSVGSSEEF